MYGEENIKFVLFIGNKKREIYAKQRIIKKALYRMTNSGLTKSIASWSDFYLPLTFFNFSRS